MPLSPRDIHERRAQRNRTRLKKVGNGRLRLSVHRSSKNISAQIIDDAKGVMSDNAARDNNVGGEVLCRVY